MKKNKKKEGKRPAGSPGQQGRDRAGAGGGHEDRPVTTLAWAERLVARLALRTTGVSEEDLATVRGQAGSLWAAPVAPAAAAAEDAPVVLRSLGELEQLAPSLAAEPAVAVDLETSDLDPCEGEIVGIVLATARAAYYVPAGHRFEDTGGLLPDQVPAAAAAEALGLGRLTLVAHNAKFERRWLCRHAGVTAAFAWDTMLAARLPRSDLPADLEDVATRELDVPDWSLPRKDLERSQFLPVDRVARYRARDGGQDALCPTNNGVIEREEKSAIIAPRKYKAGKVMSQSKLSEQKLQEIRELAAGWGKIVARRAGESGEPLDLWGMEQLAAAAAAGLTEGTLAVLLEQQAQALAKEQPCPDCGRLCHVGHEDRPLAVKGGASGGRRPTAPVSFSLEPGRPEAPPAG